MTNEEIVADRKGSDEGFGNPEEKTAEPVVAKEETKEEVIDSPEETSEVDETTEETTDEEDLAGTVEKDTEEIEESEDVDDVVAKLTKKDKVPGYQKRIDKLTAEKYKLEAELELARAKQQEQPKTQKTYTEEQLAQAERKAIDENDTQLMFEINKERMKNLKNSLVSQYKSEQDKVAQSGQAKQKQWTTVIDRYADADNPKMDIRNVNSDLYKVAKSYFEDPELASEYGGTNGMLRAVADAFLKLSRSKRNNNTKSKSPKEKKLEQKLMKEKRKSSLGKPSHDKAQVQKSGKKSDKFMDYINERKASASKSRGTPR